MRKLSLILIILAICCFISYGVYNYLKIPSVDKPQEQENKKSDDETIVNLSQYMKKNYNTNFLVNNFSCSALNNHSIKFLNYHSLSTSTMLLDDNSFYEILLNGKYYSNNEQCREIKINFKIKDVKWAVGNDTIFITNDNTAYYYGESAFADKEKISFYKYNYPIKQTLIESNVQKIVSIIDDGTNYDYKYIKNDGNIYKKSPNKKETLVLSNETYGNIIDAAYRGENAKIIITDKGLYYASIDKNDKCNTYVDVKCTILYKESAIYKKYKNDILYIDSKTVLTNDYKLFETNALLKSSLK